MRILGIGGSTHDFSFCLLENGKILKAIEEERLSREKNAVGIRSWLFQGLNYCLGTSDIDRCNLDMIVTNNLCDLLSLTQKRTKEIHNILSVNHHIAHASSSYYTSPFREAAILVVDASGDFYNNRQEAEVMSQGFAHDGKIELFYTEYSDVHQYFTLSIGHFYLFITYQCGFGFGEEGKLMGLSAYGTNKYVDRIAEGMDFTSHRYLTDHVKQTVSNIKQKEDSFQCRADLAFAAQYLLEQALYRVMNQLYNTTKCKNLCMAGGVALNSLMNGKIKKHTPFENVYVFPAAGDSGTAVGAALYGYYVIGKNKFNAESVSRNVFFGKKYTTKNIRDALQKNRNVIEFKQTDEATLFHKTSELLKKGASVGWFQGRAEMGPRALGNRSILADPRLPEMKDIINQKVKFRENFRPFAPVVLSEHVSEYFDSDFLDNPYMLYIGEVKKEKRMEIAATTHVDGTARFQTVDKTNNPPLYKLIQEFYKATGVPVLLNTSFNTKGEPMVESPEHAIHTFLRCELDVLVMDNFIITKKAAKTN